MRAIVMLFKHADTVDSEEYIYPNITKVDVTIDGRPNAVYSNGIGTDDLYREARRIFHVKDTNMTEKKFYDNKFALVIDLRCTYDNDAMAAGYNVTDTKSGVQLIITKEVTTKDVKEKFTHYRTPLLVSSEEVTAILNSLINKRNGFYGSRWNN